MSSVLWPDEFFVKYQMILIFIDSFIVRIDYMDSGICLRHKHLIFRDKLCAENDLVLVVIIGRIMYWYSKFVVLSTRFDLLLNISLPRCA